MVGLRVRSAVRGIMETVSAGAGFTALARRAFRHRVAVIAYHNVIHPDDAGGGDRSLHLPFPDFVDQLDLLMETHDIVDLRHAATASTGGRPRAVITFDDAYRGAVTLALPELVRRGLPATLFVSPTLVGAKATWWDEMAAAGLLTPGSRAFALSNRKGEASAVRDWAFPERRRPRLPDSYGIATLDEIRAHVMGGIVVGSHAWAHEHLPSLSASELRQSLGRSIEWIRDFPGPSCGWLALPYGGGSRELGRVALALGYEGVLRISGGLWSREGDRSGVPRINVPSGVSLAGFEMRVSGLFPAA